MGKLLNTFSKVQNSLRVFHALRKVSVDAIREALHEAEQDLSALQAMAAREPGFCSPDGVGIHDLVAAKIARIQELRADLHGDC